MHTEQKFKPMFKFIPNSFLILNSNMICCETLNIIQLDYLEEWFIFHYIPSFKDYDLFKVMLSGEASGKLFPYLSGFINWILNYPQEKIDIIKLGENQITKLIYNKFSSFICIY